jgi:hypothetical protein
MTRSMTFGGIAVGALIAGLVTFAFRPGHMVPVGPTPAAHSVQTQDDPSPQRSDSGSVADSVLREAARRRLAKALVAQDPAKPTQPVEGTTSVQQAASPAVQVKPDRPVEAAVSPVQVSAPAAPAPRQSDDAGRLSALAVQSIDNGDIVGARLLLERAARNGEGKALFMLAETYDPLALARMNVRGLTGEPETARTYYVRALSAGVGEARERLAALPQ